MATVYEYQIATSGAGTAGLTNLEELSTHGTGYYDVNPPFDGRVEPYPYVYSTQDGYSRADGYPTCTWRFDWLTTEMINTLRQYCTAAKSAQVYIRTLQENDDGYANYLAIMHWPAQTTFVREPSPKDIYRSFSITFTHLEEQ